MNPTGSAPSLGQAAKDLLIAWEEAKFFWRDGKAADFEHKYIASLPEHVAKAVKAMGELEVLLKKVKSDCE